jgi:hypothetical protein
MPRGSARNREGRLAPKAPADRFTWREYSEAMATPMRITIRSR